MDSTWFEDAEQPRSDAELMELVEAGADGAVAELFQRYHPDALRYAQSLTRESSRAGDLASDAFLRVWEAVRSGRRPDRLRGYLMTVVHNLWINELRRQRHQALGVDPTDPSGMFEPQPVPDFVDSIVERDTLAAAARTMCHRQRHILWETVVEGYSTRELAERHGAATPNAASQLAYRAKRTMKAAYLSSLGPATPQAG